MSISRRPARSSSNAVPSPKYSASIACPSVSSNVIFTTFRLRPSTRLARMRSDFSANSGFSLPCPNGSRQESSLTRRSVTYPTGIGTSIQTFALKSSSVSPAFSFSLRRNSSMFFSSSESPAASGCPPNLSSRSLTSVSFLNIWYSSMERPEPLTDSSPRVSTIAGF